MNQWMGNLLLIWLAGIAPLAHGQTSCLPEFTSLQLLETVSPSPSFTRFYPLLSERPSGRFATRARLRLSADASDPSRLNLTVLFDPDFDGFSLAYNLYAVHVLVDGEPVYIHDFTGGCARLGPSIFPGGEIHLAPVNLIGGKPQKLQIMVWGKL